MAILKAKLSSGGGISGQLARRGPQGYSAYDIAVQHGYTGTEEDWVNKWLRGTIVSVTTDSENNLVMTDINGNVFSVPVPSLSEAADSAAQAKQSATDAQTAQTAAASSASSASTSATNAKAAMNTANTAASSASTSATSASASASNASKSEVAAKTAQAAAEKARDDANSAIAKLTGVMKYAGQVDNYSDLSDIAKNKGDVWNIVNADTANGIKAGDNVAWNGTNWDNLSGVVDLSAYAEKADYQKAITSATANGATITFNHKDGTTSTATVNNVASSTSATNDAKGQKIDATYEKIADASNVHTSLQNSINTKQDKLTFDTTPTDGSSNPVTSGGVKTALDGKLSLSGGTVTGTVNLKNGLTSTGAIQVNPNTTFYNEDIRLNESTAKWATIYMGAPLNSTSGANKNAWGISRIPDGKLDFFLNSSSSTLSTGLRLNGDGTALLGGKEVVKNTGTWDISITGNATALGIFANRPYDANIQKGDGLVRYFVATSSMVKNKPMKDAAILHLAWDNNGGFDSQLAITNVDAHIQTRSQNGGAWGAWKTFLDEKNYTDYVPTKTGGGASGTWGINITGTATKANQDASGNVITDTYATKDYVTRAIKEALAAATITDDGKVTYKG